jgi:hypothetical protein
MSIIVIDQNNKKKFKKPRQNAEKTRVFAER